MSLSALPTAFVVPPLNLLLPCAAGLVLMRWRPRVGRAVLWAGLAGLLVLSLPIVSDALLVSLETDLPLAPAGASPEAIVILSADAFRDGDVWDPGPLTLERLRAGVALQRRTGLPVLVTGGTVDEGEDTLAAIMARSLADDFQVPVRWIELAAQDTRENAVLGAAMLRADGIRSAYVVTHAWHMRRSVLAFAGTGIAVSAAPVRMDRIRTGDASSFVPRVRSWQDSYYALHEWIGLAAAHLAPGRGGAVPKAAAPG